jgi:hypothetical protein
MSDKLFLFTEEELSQIKDSKTKGIGLTGNTWEDAMRLMLKKPFGKLYTEKDGEDNATGYRVSWLEDGEQEGVLQVLPPHVAEAFQSMNFDEEFISISLSHARKLIRENWK